MIRSMNQSFQDFTQTHVSKDDSEFIHLIPGLKSLSDQYNAMVDSMQENAEESPPPTTMNEVEKRLSAVNVLPKVVHESPITSATKSASRPPLNMGHIWGYSMETDPVQSQQYATNSSGVARSAVSQMSQGNTLSPPLSQAMTVAPPFTYSFEETTFARRLHRASLELAYRLACDRSRAPAKFERVFELWTKWVPSISHIQDQLRTCLQKGVGEPLSMWHFPLSHIGGAGTHYPRQETNDGGWKEKPGANQWNVRLVSAPTLDANDPESDCQTSMLHLINTEPGFQGEWFDAYDVEGYLAERGITIDPQSSFADVELPLSEVVDAEQAEYKRVGGNSSGPPSVSGISTRSGLSSGHSSSSSVPTAASLNTAATSLAESSTTSPPGFQQYDGSDYGNFDINNFSMVGFSDAATGSFMNFLPQTTQPYQSERPTQTCPAFSLGNTPNGSNTDYSGGMYMPMPAATTISQQTRMVTIDVAKLIISKSHP